MAEESKNEGLFEVDEEMELTDEEMMENSSMNADCSTIEVVLVPQCVECPYNMGAIECEIFGEKPSQYMSNSEECPREK